MLIFVNMTKIGIQNDSGDCHAPDVALAKIASMTAMLAIASSSDVAAVRLPAIASAMASAWRPYWSAGPNSTTSLPAPSTKVTFVARPAGALTGMSTSMRPAVP